MARNFRPSSILAGQIFPTKYRHKHACMTQNVNVGDVIQVVGVRSPPFVLIEHVTVYDMLECQSCYWACAVEHRTFIK